MNLILRAGCLEDAEVCGAICFEAFRLISAAHNFPLDIPAPEIATGFLSVMLTHPRFYSVVAELDGQIVGSNFLDERNSIGGIGPITVTPHQQNKAVGRQLMEAVLNRAASAPGVRLVQAAFHSRSLALYTKLGFQVREPLACMQGPPAGALPPGTRVRRATTADAAACAQICRQVHGFDRQGELHEAIQQRTATVVERDGRVTGYATSIGFFGHAVALTNEDLQALISAAPTIAGSGILVPMRNAELFRWCLANRLRMIQPMMLMSRGFYNEPAGAFLPSISY